MNYNTAVRRSVLSSLNLKKVIIKDTVNSQVIVNGEIRTKPKAIYKAYFENDGEYKDIVLSGYTETDVFKKLNDSIFNRYKKNHPTDFETICRTARVVIKVPGEQEQTNTEE